MLAAKRYINRFLALVLVATVVFATLGLGFLAGLPGEVNLVHAAACKAANAWCIVTYRTAAMDVVHVVQNGESVNPVEPDVGEDLAITAYWNTAATICLEHFETASATVSWSGTAWQLSNVTTTVNITDLSICNEQICSSVDVHGHGYRLIAKVNDPYNPGGGLNYNLRRVEFTTTSVDDGYELDLGTCTLGTAVGPTSQTFSAADTGAFDCGYTCDAMGTSMTITYE